MVHCNRGLCELCARPNERYVRFTEGVYEMSMESSSGSSNEPGPLTAPVVLHYEDLKTCKTFGSGQTIDRNMLKQIVLRRF